MPAARTHRSLISVVVPIVLLVAGLAIWAFLARSDTGSRSPSRSSQTRGRATTRRGTAQDLPPEAQTTLALIDKGGPFPYRRDGVVYENRAHNLPNHARGYFHEYTVVTPGAPTRGARRIIAGGGGERWYTGDHYRSFVKVR